MAWTMGDKELAALLQGSGVPANAVAQEVAAALLRSVARQAIISAAADAVAQLSCGQGPSAVPFLMNPPVTQTTANEGPGGGIDHPGDEPGKPNEPYP